MFFEGWMPLLRIFVVGVLAFLALLLLLRISGKRTLSKMNAFDFVVTVALGSTLATVLLSKDTPLVDGVFALGLLIALQFVITWLSVRSPTVSQLVKAQPRLLVYRGAYLEAAMKAERVNAEEIRQAMRNQGIGDVTQAEAVVLETDGNLSVIRNVPEHARTTLETVRGAEKFAPEGEAPARKGRPRDGAAPEA